MRNRSRARSRSCARSSSVRAWTSSVATCAGKTWTSWSRWTCADPAAGTSRPSMPSCTTHPCAACPRANRRSRLPSVRVRLLLVMMVGRSRRRQLLALLRSQAWDMANEGGDGRDLFVLVVDAEGGHARGPEAVLDHPEELGVAIALEVSVDRGRC